MRLDILLCFPIIKTIIKDVAALDLNFLDSPPFEKFYGLLNFGTFQTSKKGIIKREAVIRQSPDCPKSNPGSVGLKSFSDLFFLVLAIQKVHKLAML